jgi:aerobic-type carbon monoxide dehydrogenase small subunit (CoxS/CutS family)
MALPSRPSRAWAAQLDGATVDTIEGLSDTGTIRDLQDAFVAHNAAQCGFCTPGMLMAAADILEHQPGADRAAIREHLSGNYCRCTGYQAIVDAVETTLAGRKGART